MMERLVSAWQGFVDLYVRTNIQPAGGPLSAVIWGEADVRLLVAHLLMGTNGNDLRVHQEVIGFGESDPVALVVTDPGPWLREDHAPWALFAPSSAVDLAVEIRVVNDPRGHAAVEEGARKLQAIRRGRLAREAALCVLDKSMPHDRLFYEDLEDSRGITILRAFDEDLLRLAGPRPPAA